MTLSMMKAIDGQESEYPHPSYICTHECDFILHEVSDNLHTKKSSSLTYTLTDWLYLLPKTFSIVYVANNLQWFRIRAWRFYNYVRSASIVEGYIQESHSQSHEPLSILNCPTTCSSCEQNRSIMLLFIGKCEDFFLCFGSATPPKLYTTNTPCRCSTSSIHVEIIGARYARREQIQTRPRWHQCSAYCEGPSIFKKNDMFFCSLNCIMYLVETHVLDNFDRLSYWFRLNLIHWYTNDGS